MDTAGKPVMTRKTDGILVNTAGFKSIIYELTKEQYDALDKKMKESDAGTIMHQGRHSICQSMTDAVLIIRLFLTTTMKNSARGRTS